MTTIFISYSHKDILHAEKVEAALKAKGYEVWRDITSKDLAVGRYVPDGIASGIERADYLAILITKNALDSRWMKHELFTFLMKDQKWENLLPICLDSARPQDFHPILSACKYADFREFDTGLKEIYDRLGEPALVEKETENQRKRLYFAIELAVRAGNVVMRHYNSSIVENLALDDRKNAATLADQSAQTEVIRAIINNDDFKSECIISEEGEYKKHKVDEDGITWVIDPLDGTINFENNIPMFCSAIGVLDRGEPIIGVVYDPVSNEVYYSGYGSLTRVWSISKGDVRIVRSAGEITNLTDCVVGIHVSSRDEIAKRMVDSGLLSSLQRKVRHIRALGCGQLALAYVASGRLQAFLQLNAALYDQLAGVVLVNNSSGGNTVNVPLGKKWTHKHRDFCAAANSEICAQLSQHCASFLKKGRSRL